MTPVHISKNLLQKRSFFIIKTQFSTDSEATTTNNYNKCLADWPFNVLASERTLNTKKNTR